MARGDVDNHHPDCRHGRALRTAVVSDKLPSLVGTEIRVELDQQRRGARRRPVPGGLRRRGLGGKWRDKIRIYADTPEADTPQEFAAIAKARKDRGLTWIKVDVKGNDIFIDVG